MKKLLTLGLALLLTFALAAPAMAFTSTSAPASTVPYKLSIYLVDYSDSGFFGMITLPAADRGYAKNEIVAAVVELFVPKNTDPDSAYGSLVFSGTNVSLNVTDNSFTGSVASLRNIGLGTGITPDTFSLNSSADALWRDDDADFGGLKASDVTYKWLFFAKVLADGGKLTATLTDGRGVGNFQSEGQYGTLRITLGGIDYEISKNMGSAPYGYTIYVNGGTYEFSAIWLITDSTGKTIGMRMQPIVNGAGAATVTLGVSTTGVLGYLDPNSPSVLITSASQAVASPGTNEYTQLMAVYNDVVKGVFGLDYFKIGNYLYDSFFTSMASTNTITASVDIKPFAPYVTVPQVVVVNPPKTGDAVGMLGFVLITLATAAAVIVRKVRA